jgi:hypothetical protein
MSTWWSRGKVLVSHNIHLRTESSAAYRKEIIKHYLKLSGPYILTHDTSPGSVNSVTFQKLTLD